MCKQILVRVQHLANASKVLSGALLGVLGRCLSARWWEARSTLQRPAVIRPEATQGERMLPVATDRGLTHRRSKRPRS